VRTDGRANPQTSSRSKAEKGIPLPLLQKRNALLLELRLRLPDLSRLFRGKQVGHEQRSHLDMPGLRAGALDGVKSGRCGRRGLGGQEGKMNKPESLLPKHGGYRNLKSFQVAQLVYDITVRFCSRYIEKKSRTTDQMVQAARSGVQNIAEGSLASATSKKMEIKLTQVARASLEELRLDYEDFLRQRNLPLWPQDEPLRQALINRRCRTADEIAAWIVEACTQSTKSMPSTPSTKSTQSQNYPIYAANAALTLLAVACSLLDRQVARLAQDFTTQGGFTERLYRVRTAQRNQQNPKNKS
jgi:four helix bundle suffix protein